jgi:hypothetical protein
MFRYTVIFLPNFKTIFKILYNNRGCAFWDSFLNKTLPREADKNFNFWKIGNSKRPVVLLLRSGWQCDRGEH